VRSEEGIPKKVKPDFEAIVALPLAAPAASLAPSAPLGAALAAEGGGGGASGYEIAVFGSASKAGLRDGIALLHPASGAPARALEARTLMEALRRDARVTGSAKLNLEAAALVGDGALALFNR
jgi:hypothetical protein